MTEEEQIARDLQERILEEEVARNLRKLKELRDLMDQLGVKISNQVYDEVMIEVPEENVTELCTAMARVPIGFETFG